MFPKKVKYRKWQRSRDTKKKIATRGVVINFGDFGLRAMSMDRLRSNQIEAARKVISRTVGKVGKVWIRVFTDRPYTQKANNVGMGKGKGDLKGFEVEVLPGRIIFEVGGVEESVAREALRKGGKKLPVKVKIDARV